MYVVFSVAYVRHANCFHCVSVEWLMRFEDEVWLFLNMCIDGVCSLILTDPHTNQIHAYDYKWLPNITWIL